MPTTEPKVVRLSELSVSDTAARFEGRDHGAQMSFFVTDHPPGGKVPLHVHPYEEVFVVREGALVVPPETPHGFANKGDSPLKIVSIHPNDHVEQTWL